VISRRSWSSGRNKGLDERATPTRISYDAPASNLPLLEGRGRIEPSALRFRARGILEGSGTAVAPDRSELSGFRAGSAATIGKLARTFCLPLSPTRERATGGWLGCSAWGDPGGAELRAEPSAPDESLDCARRWWRDAVDSPDDGSTNTARECWGIWCDASDFTGSMSAGAQL